MKKPKDETKTTTREATDKSLGDERHKTDAELRARWRAIETDTDRIVNVARQSADARFLSARAEADDRMWAGGESGRALQAHVAGERAREDATLADERALEDQQLAVERTEQRQALGTLLRRERAATDRQLAAERRHTDDASERQEAFFSMVSHDLMNLLGAMSLNVTALGIHARQGKRPDLMLESADQLRELSVHMSRLVGDLADDASIAAGALQIVPTEGDVVALAEAAAKAFSHTATASKIRLRLERLTSTAPASFDYDRMLQVLANLVGNALKFTPHGGTVVIEVGSKKDAVHVTVADSGPGVSPDEVAAIFERFKQGRHRRGGGLGLGLFIAKCIVEAHGGTIGATNRADGFTVHFTLPGLPSDNAGRRPLPASPPMPGQG